jgi:hypothetical protein
MQLSKARILGVTIGFSLVIAGVLVFAYGYLTNYAPSVSYENGYTYIDYVPLSGYSLIINGFAVLFLTMVRPLSKWAREHGAIVRGGF